MPEVDQTGPITTAAFEEKYGARALFERYAQVRIRQVYLRQWATAIGAASVWYFVSPLAALSCILVTLVGEFFDVALLKYAVAQSDKRKPMKPLLRLTAFSAGCQSATLNYCILLLMLFAPTGEAVLVAIFFLMAAAVNAGFIITHHQLACQVKLAVLSCVVPVYLVHAFGQMGPANTGPWIHVIELLMAGYIVYTFIEVGRQSWNRRLKNERRLMDTAARLEATNRDLERARQETEAAAQAKSTFLATISHEIRTPLNAISGMSELLKLEGLDGVAGRNVDIISDASDALLRIINDVLDFSRLDAGHMTLEMRDFSPTACIDATQHLFTPLAREKGLTLTVSDDGSLPATVCGDDTRLKQILMNLVANAIKFTDTGAINVTARATRDGDDWVLVVRVTDSGKGVAPEHAEQIFDPFNQGDTATARRHGGTGLGLSISRALARRMGGDLRLVSTAETAGTTFELCVAFKPAMDEVSASSEAAPAAPSACLTSPLSVLLAEDNVVNRMVIEQFLKGQPITLFLAENGRQAVDISLLEEPDVILMDVNMPELDGLGATREIRGAQARQPYIIALTANAFASDRDACLAAGMDDFLSKPVRQKEVHSALARAAEARQLR